MIALLMQHGAFISAVSAPLAVIDTFQGTAPWSRINREGNTMFNIDTEPSVLPDEAEVSDLLLTDFDLSLIDASVDEWPEADERLVVPFEDGLGLDWPATDIPF